MWERREIRAAVVEQVGRYANWFDRDRRVVITGVKKFFTISLSVRRDRIDTTEMGRMWAGSTGDDIFGIG